MFIYWICILNTYIEREREGHRERNILDNLAYGYLAEIGVGSWCIVLGEWVRMEDGKGLTKR